MQNDPAFTFVLFAGTGDLSMCKLQAGGMHLQPMVPDLALDKASKHPRAQVHERRLRDAVRGDLAAWDNSSRPPKPDAAGTWGPAASSALLYRAGFAWSEERQ